MSKRILVTGANGFIGSNLIKQLKNMDMEFYGVGRSTNDSIDNYICADISSRDFADMIVANIQRCDVIVHLAANIDMKDGRSDIESNCIGTYNVCQLANEWRCDKIVYMSSIPVIGEPKELPIRENHETHPMTIYHVTKLAGEKILEVCCDSSIKKITLRIPSPIGVGMNMNTFLPIILQKCISGEKVSLYGKGLRCQNYVDVRDVVQAVLKTLDYEKNGLFNIAGLKAISNIELARLCKKITNSDSSIVFADVEDKEENFKWDISIEKAAEELNFKPQISLEESIMCLYESMRV